MKYILILFSFVSASVAAQESTASQLLVKKITASLRTQLIKEDSVFIDNFVSNISSDNCDSFQILLNSKYNSNVVIAEICKQLISTNIGCYTLIIDNIAFYRMHPEAIRYNDSNNFPISMAIWASQINKEKITNYIISSNYLNDCQFTSKHTAETLRHLKYLLVSASIDEEQIGNRACVQYNLSAILKLN